METNNKNRWQISLAALVVFLLGFIAGALTLNLYNANRFSTATATDQRGGKSKGNHMEDIIEDLHLNEQQKVQVDQILSEARTKFRELRKQTYPLYADAKQQVNDKLKQVLTPEQWQQFEQRMKAERERRHNRRERRNSDKLSDRGAEKALEKSLEKTTPPSANN